MNRQADYIEQEEYSAIMNYDPHKERADVLSDELFRAKMELKLMEKARDSWRDAYNKLESILLNKL